MTASETTRQKLLTVVKAFHAAKFPTYSVNYPNKWVTDTEKEMDPFVSVEFSLEPQHMSMRASKCLRITGDLVCNFFVREGTGSKQSTTYTDEMHDYLGLQVQEGITFWEVKPFNNRNIKGFDGTMNTVRFEIEYFN